MSTVHASLRWIAIAVGSLVVVLLLTGVALYALGQRKAVRAPDFTTSVSLAVPTDSATISRGRHVATAIAPCAACYGAGLAGQSFGTPPMLVSMAAPNLTRGRGGVGDNTPAQWERAIRGGIGRDGRQLAIMPSAEYARMSDADLAAVIAYLRSLPAVDNELPPRRLGPAGAIVIGAGVFKLPAEVVAEARPRPSVVQPAATAEYGAYLVELATCRACHAADLQGAEGNEGVPAPSLRARARGWSEAEFREVLRSGRTPDGRMLDGDAMPWPYYRSMTDGELRAIWLYIRSQPPHQDADA